MLENNINGFRLKKILKNNINYILRPHILKLLD